MGLAVILLSACTPTATPFPAMTLIVDVSPTATLNAASATPAPLTPTALPDEPLLSSEIALDSNITLRLRQDLAQETGIALGDIRLVHVKAAEWHTDALGCRETPSEVVITGTDVELLAGQSVYTYHVSGDRMQRCDKREPVHGPLLMAVDPAALEMVLLAQQHVGQTLDLPTRRIQLVDVLAYTWVDTSLGCPAPKQSYVSRPINGYRVIVSAGTDVFAFHTDSERLIPCEAGREVLPS